MLPFLIPGFLINLNCGKWGILYERTKRSVIK